MSGRRTIRLWLFVALSLSYTASALAQLDVTDSSSFEEIPIEIRLLEAGTMSATVLRSTYGETFYNLEEVFSLCKIACVIDNTGAAGGTARGFYLVQSVPYHIDPDRGVVRVGDSTYKFSAEKFTRRGRAIFIAEKVFTKAFVIDINFQFQDLAAVITSKYVLPAVSEYRRRRIHQSQSMIVNDTRSHKIISSPPAFSLGTIDWFLSSSASRSAQSVGLISSIGGRIAGGETRLDITTTPAHAIDQRALRGLWRYAFMHDESAFPTAIEVGDVGGGNLRALPLRGVHVTNAPLAPRRFAGNEAFHQDLPVGWQSETYLNDELIGFYEGSESESHFTRSVPLRYGSSYLTTHTFGPHGEKRTRNNVYTVPAAMLPHATVEYSFSYGITDLYRHTSAGNGSVRWAPFDRLAVGGGIETSRDELFNSTYPFFSLSSRLADALVVSGMFASGVLEEASAQWTLPSLITIEAEARRMQKPSIYNPNGLSRTELNASVFAPFTLFSSAVGTTTRARRITTGVNLVTSLSSQMGFASPYGQWNLRWTGTTFDAPSHGKVTTSNFSIGWAKEVLRNFFITTQIGTEGRYLAPSPNIEVIDIGANLRFSPSLQLSTQFQHRLSAQNTSLFITLSFETPASRTRVTLSNVVSDGSSTVVANQLSQGSISFPENNVVWNNNGFSVGKGGLMVEPFLDKNINGVRDAGEEVVRDMDVVYHQASPRTTLAQGEELVTDIPPYSPYRFSVGAGRDGSDAWVARDKEYAVDILPGGFTVVNIPVYPNTELRGSVVDEHGTRLPGLSVVVKDSSGERGRTNVFSDGSFSVYGMTPGNYIVTLDALELAPLGFPAAAPEIHIEIPPSAEQQIIGNIAFIVKH